MGDNNNIWRAVQWWDEWQLRILVLGSLGLQWFLLLAAPMRNYNIWRWFRKCIWLAYVSADALSIYALATLFNRHARTGAAAVNGAGDYVTKGSSLEVLWAPLILVYLGGREEITAYTIEDNELWTRHTVTLVSQVTVAVYAFCKSWPADSTDGRLLLSAILLFVVGVLSFCEKPWALRRASINSLVAISSLMQGGEVDDKPGCSSWDWCFRAEMGRGSSIWWYTNILRQRLLRLRRRWRGGGSSGSAAPPEPDEKPILSQGVKVQMMLSDLSLHAAEVTLRARLKQQQQQGGQQQIILEPLVVGKGYLRPWLRQAFGLIYTRANVIVTPAYWACHVLLVPSLYAAAIVLFAASHKQQQRGAGDGGTDVKITYVLLCFTAVLDVFGLSISDFMYWLVSSCPGLAALCETLPGHNLVDSVLWETEHPWLAQLLSLAKLVGYKERHYTREKDHGKGLYDSVSQFITAELVSVSREKENADLSSYRSFADGASHNWTLKDVRGLDGIIGGGGGGGGGWVRRVLRRSPFDESVLIWHIATDLCFRRDPPDRVGHRPPLNEVLREVCIAAISNYMAYLLNFQPDLLMTGSRQHVFTEASRHMRSIVSDGMTADERRKFFSSKKGEAAKIDSAVLNKITAEAAKLAAGGSGGPDDDIHQRRRRRSSSSRYYTPIHEACLLAKELLAIGDKDVRWELMYRVWVGMLCYSASMCRGYLHAKSLGEGGEFLSYVWLVVSLKGAKTLADKLQMPDPEPEDDGGDVIELEEIETTTTTTPPTASA